MYLSAMATSTAAFSTFSEAMTGNSVATWIPNEVVWLLSIGFVAAFILAFSVGANDVANSFGTTVGAKVLTLRQACILATFFETSGAVLLGAKVGEMIRKGIIDVEVYKIEDGARLLMMGEVSAMFGSAFWQLIATIFKVPVSGTHSIVGACIGFSLVAVGSTGVNWHNLGYIVASWFISPALSGVMAVALYYVVRRFILKSDNQLKSGLKMLPFFYAITVGVNAFSIFYSGAPLLGLSDLPIWGTIFISVGLTLVVGIFTLYFSVPRLKKRESLNNSDKECLNFKADAEQNLLKSTSVKSLQESSAQDLDLHDTDATSSCESIDETVNDEPRFVVKIMTSDTSLDQNDDLAKPEKKAKKKIKPEKAAHNVQEEKKDVDSPVVHRLFSSLQVLTACFASFAHGGNDVSNAIGPLIALWIVFGTGEVLQNEFTPWYLLLYGGAGISLGLWVLGRRVMKTVGEDLTEMTASRGFCIELMTAITVLFASNVGIPISTTHCKVGAVVSIGWFRSRSAVDWSTVRNIALAWFVTLPVSGLLSAGTMLVLMQFL